MARLPRSHSRDGGTRWVGGTADRRGGPFSGHLGGQVGESGGARVRRPASGLPMRGLRRGRRGEAGRFWLAAVDGAATEDSEVLGKAAACPAPP